jgi:hypothetical protein
MHVSPAGQMAPFAHGVTQRSNTDTVPGGHVGEVGYDVQVPSIAHAYPWGQG